jgi:hypothetical protein
MCICLCILKQVGGAGGGRVRLTAASLTVATGASISADGRTATGPGAGGIYIRTIYTIACIERCTITLNMPYTVHNSCTLCANGYIRIFDI